MPYSRSQMVYKDYLWNAKADHDNPKFIGAQERSMLNRSEGYEMLWFINSLAKTWKREGELAVYQSIEKIIIGEVPGILRTHSKIKEWIEAKYDVTK